MVRTSASQLKAKMGRYMHAVRSGQEVVVTDRNVPVARLIPFQPAGRGEQRLEISQPRDPSAPPLARVHVASISYHGRGTTDLLREERQRR